jgi:Zn-finger nucleic acid-binding protein
VTKQTRITIETDSLLYLRGRSSTRGWCPSCGAEVEMIALENAGIVSNLEPQALEEWLNSGELHQSRTTDGVTLTCLNSLLARVQKPVNPPGRSAATEPSKEKK